VIALTHTVSPQIHQCELSHLSRMDIDYERAVRQHTVYCQKLRELGCEVIELTQNEHLPDSTFIEDTAVVLNEIAVMANMGVISRQPEVASVAQILAQYRQLAHIQPPATLEGGDVLRMGQTLYVGLSARTNRAGVESLQNILAPWGYRIVVVSLRDCLHLKSACSALDEKTLLVNPAWLDLAPLGSFDHVCVPTSEPGAANVLSIAGILLMHAGFPETATRLRELGFRVETLDISELMKAEAAVTCSSILFEVSPAS